MKINEALGVLLKKDKEIEALELVRSNKSEVEPFLIENLKCAIVNIETRQKNEVGYEVECVLQLIGDLEVKNAFPYLVKILEFKGEATFLGIRHMTSLFFGEVLFRTVTDEKDISILKGYVVRTDVEEANKLSAYYAIQEFYSVDDGMREDLEAFNRNLIADLYENEFDHMENHGLLLSVAGCSLHEELFGLYDDLQALLVKVIIESGSGYHFGGFKDYFEYLYRIDPLMPAKLHDVKKYIKKLRNCTDKEIFQFDSLTDVGKYLFSKVVGAVAVADSGIVKMAIKQLNRYPYNHRIVPCIEDQYYEELCYILDIYKVPKTIYEQAQELYESVFVIGYSKVKQCIHGLIEEIKKKKCEIWEAEKNIRMSKADQWNLQKIEELKRKLVEYNFKEKELGALYKSEPDEAGLLVYYLKSLDGFMESFCGDMEDAGKVDETIRKMSITSTGSEAGLIDERFAPYRRVLHQFEILLDETPSDTLYNIFYKVKFIPFVEKLYLGNHANKAEDIDKHPLNPKNLADCFERDTKEYCKTLEEYSGVVIDQIRESISNSICLRERKAIIEQCLLMIENKNDEMVMNLLPVQIEGLFVDLLEYSTIYKFLEDIKQYKRIMELELVYKIDFALGKDVNLSFDSVAYFKYYFNNIVRNTVAHGNYKLLVQGRNVGKENPVVVADDLVKRIIALELLYDLHYLVYTIEKINEIDTVDKYISEAYENYSQSVEKGDMDTFYQCVFEDLSGMRDRYKLSDYRPGLFVVYDPLQLFYWIFHPYYGKYLNAEKRGKIQQVICSLEFWDHVEGRLSEKEIFGYNRLNAEKFQTIIHRMYKLDLEENVKRVINKVDNILSKIN